MKKLSIILSIILVFLLFNCAYAYDADISNNEPIYIRISYYNPKLCGNNDKWDINCDSNPEHLSLVPNFTDDLYHKNVVACPVEWIGHIYTTVLTIEGRGEYWCLDTGGAIQLTHGTEYTQNGWETISYIPIDFLLLEPPHDYLWVYKDWSTEWRLLNEFWEE